MIEAADQGKQGRVGHRLVPVIESGAERLLAPHGADDGAEDDRHPQQRGKASGEADAGEGGEERPECSFAGQKRTSTWVDPVLATDSEAAPRLETPAPVRSRLSAKLSQQTGSQSGSASRGTAGTLAGSKARRCAAPRRTRSGSPAPDPRDGPRSTGRASREVRARATARNTTRPRHRRCGEPAIAAVPGRSAPALHRSRLRTRSIVRSARSSRSAAIDGKRRQAAPMISDISSAVTACARAKPVAECAGITMF